MVQANILIIEDDEIVARTIERVLRGHEFKITVTNSGVDGLQTARRNPPDLVILDVIMPGMDGYTVCRELRADPILNDVPVLFLTAKIKDEDKVMGFTTGADDYLTKPFNIDELVLRVRAIIRRTRRSAETRVVEAAAPSAVQPEPSPAAVAREEVKPSSDRLLNIRGFILNTRTYELTTPKMGKVRLTPVQYDLVYHLMTHPGEIFSPTRLLDEVWDYPSDAGSPDLVRVHIKNLRERVEENPRSPIFIQTVPGYGYTVPLD